MTTLSHATIDQMIDRHFKYEIDDDVSGVLTTMTADILHDTVGSPTGPLKGQDAARGFYEHLFADLKGESVKTLRRYYGDGFVVDESHWHGKAIGNPLGIPGGGKALNVRILHVFEIDADGKFTRENAWLDYAAIIQQLTH